MTADPDARRSPVEPADGRTARRARRYPFGPVAEVGKAITFEVLGLPAPQGSKTRMPNGAMLDGASPGARSRHKNWRSAVADTARDIADDEGCLTGPLSVTLTFRFPMPASRPKRVREAGWAPKVSTPDIDKIERATLDGLTAGGLIADDRFVVRLVATKCETTGWTGCKVKVEAWEG